MSQPPPIRLDDPEWSRETFARMQGDTRGALVYGYARGTITGVRDGEAVRPLMGYEVFSTTRLARQDNGDYRRLRRELVLYTDLKSGDFLDAWDNPYSGERVRVVDIANDPINATIRAAPMDWSDWDEEHVALTSDYHLFYPNALKPEVWPRESGGPMVRASEFIRALVRKADIVDPERTHLPHTGTWSRITPWLPWMLMGQAPGHIYYLGLMNTFTDRGQIPARVLARVQDRYPAFLDAPETWQESSLSSLENYALTQTPAPFPG